MRERMDLLLRTLIDDARLSAADAERATRHAQEKGVDVGEALVALDLVGSREVAIARAALMECPFVDLAHYEVSLANANLLPRAVSERFCVYPLFVLGKTATVGTLDPLNLQAIDQLRQILKCEIEPVVCDAVALRALIARAYSMVRTSEAGVVDPAQAEQSLTTGEEPIVAAVNQIIADAVACNASDIHISPDESDLHLRYRVDGVLRRQQGPARSAHASIVQRLKVMARLDLAQSRRPQDGKFRFANNGKAVDVRLSLVPTIHGENAVMRLLRSEAAVGRIADLGMPGAMSRWFEDAINRPNGLILVTGPTGSGKTTTLFSALSYLNTPDRNIVTIEDPVEIRLPMVRQVQVNHEIGLDFAAALRSILRQDPDVVLVGEIRDQETARIATQAAMTGHLVLSTLHTNDAVSAVSRLRDFGLPVFAINSALLCVIAQRLVRQLCSSCAEPEAPTPEAVHALGLAPEEAAAMKRGRGCPACMNAGYRGRLGVFEMVRLSNPVRDAIEAGAPVGEVRAAAERDGFQTMLRDGISKATRGLTTCDELYKLRAVLEADAVSRFVRNAA